MFCEQALYILNGECEAILFRKPSQCYYFNYKTNKYYLKKGIKYRLIGEMSLSSMTNSHKDISAELISNKLYKKIKFENPTDFDETIYSTNFYCPMF